MLDIKAEKLRELAAYSGDPWTPDNEYFAQAETGMEPLWKELVYPFIEGSDFAHTVDLAAGQGRNSVILSTLAERLTIMDIQPGNVEVCKRRFSGRKNIEFVVNSGFDFQPVRAGDVTLVYCFDAMVHFDSDVIRSYLRDTHRVLAPGGVGILPPFQLYRWPRLADKYRGPQLYEQRNVRPLCAQGGIENPLPTSDQLVGRA
jgi:ubiquinone/menaquinone biosynthesis C-methylase UbiE